MIKKTFIIITGTIKAFWNATLKTVWGIAGIYFLAGLIRGMDIDASKITDLLSMSIAIIRYWVVFWAVFFASNLYKELEWELSK